MVWTCGKNFSVPYGQKGSDGGSKQGGGRERGRPRLSWMV